jgi:hypothetical protein
LLRKIETAIESGATHEQIVKLTAAFAQWRASTTAEKLTDEIHGF